jgi:hypothetical protein
MLCVQVFQRWMQSHGRTAASYFQAEQDKARAAGEASDARARVQSTPGQNASRSMRASLTNVPSAVVSKLIGGVGCALCYGWFSSALRGRLRS